ncbi:hypothetical protein RB195_001354 [Necator americanus]|uniref:Uncharacterized protein n=1 Tax=Necator americanus TaxID=51031 RepID=A0ABR1DDX3_NECAM
MEAFGLRNSSRSGIFRGDLLPELAEEKLIIERPISSDFVEMIVSQITFQSVNLSLQVRPGRICEVCRVVDRLEGAAKVCQLVVTFLDVRGDDNSAYTCFWIISSQDDSKWPNSSFDFDALQPHDHQNEIMKGQNVSGVTQMNGGFSLIRPYMLKIFRDQPSRSKEPQRFSSAVRPRSRPLRSCYDEI